MQQMKNVFGIINFHNGPSCSPLTDNRPLGSTSFLGRYAFCDFALSSLCNSGISQVGLLIRDYPRSILKHLGTMDSWVANTKLGFTRIMYNELAHLGQMPNTDVNNLLENDTVLYDSSAQYLVFFPAHIVLPIDLRPIIERHIKNGDQITVVTSQQRNVATHWMDSTIITKDPKGVVYSERNHGQFKGTQTVSLGVYIINRTTLLDLIHRYATAHPGLALRDLIFTAHREGVHRCAFFSYDGFVRNADSFQHYFEDSLEMLDKKNFEQLFRPDFPIYTLTHDTPPAIYGKEATVHNSFISNGSSIEGDVEGSIIARNVVIEKDAVIRNSIIFSSVRIKQGAIIENALVDKYSIIERGHIVRGKKKAPLYVPQGAIL